MNNLTKILIIVFSILLIGLLVLGYYGLVPGLSDIMGANTPRDLGVKYSSADLDSANSKLGITYTALPSSSTTSITESGSKQVVTSLNSAELTALLNYHASKWKHYPIEQIQIKINSDNSVEFSGVLRIDRWQGFADNVNLPESIRAEVRPYLGYVKTNPSIYMKGTLSISSPPQTTISEVQVTRFTASYDQIQSKKYVIDSFIQYIANYLNLRINSLSFSNGEAFVNAQVPTSVGLMPP